MMGIAHVIVIQIILIVFFPIILTVDKYLYDRTKIKELKNYLPATILEIALFSAGLWLGYLITVIA